MTDRIINLYRLKPFSIWKAFASESFAFKMACCYLFFEYVRPQAIWSVFEAYPYWARTFIMLAFLGWIASPKRKFVWNRFTTGIFVYLFLVILSSLFAYWPEVSEYYFMDFFNWVVVFFVLSQIVTTRQRFFILLLIFLLASFKLSFYGARVFAMRGFAFADWGLAGPRGYFQNPGELAIQMLMFAPISLFFIHGIKSNLKRWMVYLLYLMPITAALTVIGTNTRGGQIAFAAQILSLVALSKHRIKMIMLIIVIAFFGFHILPEEQKTRFQSIGDDLTSLQRILYWQHGWEMIKEHPVLGVGYFNFPPYYTKYYPEDIVLPMLQSRGAELPHNIFIQVGTDTGFTGLITFFGLILMSFSGMHRSMRLASKNNDLFLSNISKGMNIALIGYIISGQFVTVAYYPFFWIHLVFCSSIMIFGRRDN